MLFYFNFFTKSKIVCLFSLDNEFIISSKILSSSFKVGQKNSVVVTCKISNTSKSISRVS